MKVKTRRVFIFHGDFYTEVEFSNSEAVERNYGEAAWRRLNEADKKSVRRPGVTYSSMVRLTNLLEDYVRADLHRTGYPDMSGEKHEASDVAFTANGFMVYFRPRRREEVV